MEGCSDDKLKLLVSQLREGNRDAFNSLYRLHSKALLYNIRSLVKNHEDASEILQDTFLKVWENREMLDPERSYIGLVYKIARNLIYNQMRKSASDERKKTHLLKTALNEYSHVEEQLIQKENEVILNQAIVQLSTQCRKVYILSKVEGKSHQEISSILQISLATVNNHMVKGNREIRKYLLQHSEIQSSFLFLIIAVLFGR